RHPGQPAGPPPRPARLRGHRSAQERLAARGGVPGDPRGDRDRRPLRHDRPGRGRAPVRLRLQADLAGPGGDLPGSGRRADPDQPGPRQDEPPRLAGHPLARLRRLAARGRAQHRQQRRRAKRPGARGAGRLRTGHRGRAGLAAVAGRTGDPQSGARRRRTQPHVRQKGRPPMTDSLTLPHPAMATGVPSSVPPGPGLPRLLPDAGTVPVDLRAHLATHGPLRAAGGGDGLLREVAAAGLTGRGGAAFPVARKLAAAAEVRPAPVVAGNGAEGEPASSKDRSLLWLSPHLVLDGLQLAAGAVGSRSAVLYVPRNERLHIRLAGAIAERAAAGMDAASVELVTAPDRFLAGEESALVSRLAGRPALPAYRPVRGLPRLAPGRAALVQNVETLAHLALIGRYGAAWFREAGTEAEPGTMLATLHRADGRTSVTEVPLGTSLAGLLGLDGGPGPAEAGAAGPGVPSAFGPVQAVLVGGYHGAWLPAAAAAA